MERVTGIGGVFFKAKDPKKLGKWYSKHLGINQQDGAAVFRWYEEEDGDRMGYTVWSAFDKDTTYFEPSKSPFMINYRVADLDGLLAQLREEGVEVDEKGIEEYDYGRFAWIMDPEGNRVELWEPSEEDPGW